MAGSPVPAPSGGGGIERPPIAPLVIGVLALLGGLWVIRLVIGSIWSLGRLVLIAAVLVAIVAVVRGGRRR